MSNGRSAVTARARAREAKAALDKARAEREKSIEQLAIDFYAATDQVSEAQAALADATVAQAKAVAELGELKLGVDEIATLCGISAREVRAYRKAARERSEDDSESVEGETAGDA